MKDQPSPIADSTEEGFSQRSSHFRSVRKAEKALPRSPRKRNAVVSSLGKKFRVYYLNIHKVIEDDQSKILMQTKNLG